MSNLQAAAVLSHIYYWPRGEWNWNYIVILNVQLACISLMKKLRCCKAAESSKMWSRHAELPPILEETLFPVEAREKKGRLYFALLMLHSAGGRGHKPPWRGVITKKLWEMETKLASSVNKRYN